MKKVVFTIVARNYLGFAFTLVDSLRKVDDSTDLFIYVVDGTDGVPDTMLSRYPVQSLDESLVPQFKSLAFKYSVTEFSTAVKPFIIHHLFTTKGYDKLIYLDPDIYVYQSLQPVFDELDHYSCLLTPHIIDAEVEYTGNAVESEFLFSGIYNLGFLALKKSATSLQLVNWWMNRLHSLCYGDRLESLHVDQKWMDFVPAFFGAEVLSYRYPGVNIAYWNIHERELVKTEAAILVAKKTAPETQYPVLFIHFSGVNPANIYKNKQCKQLDIKKYPVWESLISAYAEAVLNNGHLQLLKLSYGFSVFANGYTITHLHRRLYRRMLDMQQEVVAGNPFSDGEKSYFSLLQANGLLTGKESGSVEIADISDTGARKRLRMLLWILRVAKRVLGIRRYYTFIRFMQKITAPENQVFLLKGFEQDFVEAYAKKYFNQ